MELCLLLHNQLLQLLAARKAEKGSIWLLKSSLAEDRWAKKAWGMADAWVTDKIWGAYGVIKLANFTGSLWAVCSGEALYHYVKFQCASESLSHRVNTAALGWSLRTRTAHICTAMSYILSTLTIPEKSSMSVVGTKSLFLRHCHCHYALSMTGMAWSYLKLCWRAVF